jgi:hypothetical protein
VGIDVEVVSVVADVIGDFVGMNVVVTEEESSEVIVEFVDITVV